MRPIALAALCLAALLALAAPARADGFIVPVTDSVPLRGTWAVKEHLVRIQVDGQQSRTEVRQTFVNLTGRPIEVQYLFPIPDGAMIKSFTLIVDGVALKGQILPADEALRIYESIVRRMKDPGLLTYAGRGLVKTRVFPLPAGGSRQVILRYEELLPRDGGHVKLVYPLDTERFSALPIEIVEVQTEIRSPSPIKGVYSPSHPIMIERPGPCHAIVTWTAKHIVPDQDLVLYYAVGKEEVGASLFTYFPPGSDAGHFLLLVSPGALDSSCPPVPKNLVLVLDHSGSMRGKKIEQAKEALRYVLQSLDSRDRVNLVGFSSTAQTLFPEARPADRVTVETALAFVSRIGAQGGTDIHSALHLALSSLPNDPGRQNVILFLTDGLPTVGVQDIAEIVKTVTAANQGVKDARLFVFGVGYDVNAAFLDRLVEENGGISENIAPKESVEIAVSSLYRKIRHTVLTDLALRFRGVVTFDVFPRQLPDLFGGSQLVVTGRYKTGGPAFAVLAGRSGTKRKAFRYPLRFEIASDPDERPFVARVWATTKIGYLLDQMRVLGRREKELVDEIVRLSTKYGVVTEYTAFLADETNDFRDFSANFEKTRRELSARLPQQDGGAGTNQALNSKRLRFQRQAFTKNYWNDDSGRVVEVRTVWNEGRKTFYRRNGVWIDREVGENEEMEEVRQFSPRFFELVRGQRAAQNRWLSARGPVVVRLGDRVVKILPAE